MKPRSLHLLTVLVWSFQAGIDARSAEAPATKPATPANLRTLTNRADRVTALAGELKLTPQQQEKLRPILQEEGQKMVAIYRDNTLSREARMAKIKEMRDANRVKVKAILTPEQMEQWDKMRQGRQPSTPQRVPPAAK